MQGRLQKQVHSIFRQLLFCVLARVVSFTEKITFHNFYGIFPNYTSEVDELKPGRTVKARKIRGLNMGIAFFCGELIRQVGPLQNVWNNELLSKFLRYAQDNCLKYTLRWKAAFE